MPVFLQATSATSGDASWGAAGGTALTVSDTANTTVTNSTSEDTLITLTVPIASLVDGALLEVRAGASVTNSAAVQTCTIRLKVEGSTIAWGTYSGGVTSTPTQAFFSLSAIRSGSNLSIMWAGASGGAAVTPTTGVTSTVAITGDVDIIVTAQWGAASMNNVVRSRYGAAYIITP